MGDFRGKFELRVRGRIGFSPKRPIPPFRDPPHASPRTRRTFDIICIVGDFSIAM